MGKNEDYSKVIKVVTELTDVTEEAILGRSREAEVVDARWMVIYFLKEKGYNSFEIAEMTNHPIRTINNASHLFLERVRYSNSSLGNIFSSARQQLL